MKAGLVCGEMCPQLSPFGELTFDKKRERFPSGNGPIKR